MKLPTILVVEDNAITRKMIRVALTAEGYAVLEAPDGRTALELAGTDAPDLVLQDMLLPDMDGFELVGRLRSLPAGAELPIIALSGFLSRADAARALALGFSDFLMKPVARSELVQTVRTYLPAPATPADRPGRGRHILAVDDDPTQLKLARIHLERHGFQVTTAGTGASALEQARRAPPDAILSDVLMPELDGFQLCLAVRQDRRLARVPVVLCSANYVEEPDRRLAERVGANALAVRSPDLAEAIEAILASLGQTPPPALAMPAELLEAERLHRVIRQLERQVATNVGLVQRASLQASVLSILAEVSQTLTRPLAVEAAPEELLASLLDVGGISTGVLFLKGLDGRLRLAAQSGRPRGTVEEAEGFFGHRELLEQTVATGRPLVLPSPAVSEAIAGELLRRLGVRSAVIVPLASQGETLGALLMAANRQDLTQHDWLGFVQTMAGQLSQCIALSRAFSRLAASEARYRSLFDNVPVGLGRTTPEGRFLDANRALVELFGHPDRESLLAVPASDFYGNRDERREWRALADREGVARGVEMPMRRRDGTSIWVRGNFRALREPDGTQVYEGSIEDITERKQTEEALRESEERFRSVFEESAVGMSLQDTNGRYLRVNQALCQMLGYSKRELVGLSSHMINHPDDRDTDVEHDRRMLAGEIGWHQLEKRYVHKLGHPVWVLASISLVRDRESRPAYFIAQAQDLTERKRVEEELQRQLETMVQTEKLAAMGQLLAGVAHELNNPLSIVLGQSALMSAKLGPGPLAQRAFKISQAAERCARIVRNFLALARHRPPERQDVWLNDVVREAVELLAYPLRLDNLEVRLDLAADLPVLWADRHQLGQVLVNLISNAHYVLREVESPRSLTLATRFDEARGLVSLEVADTGPGIPPAVQARLFEPFFTTKPPGQGTGLGLSLCRGIVENHQGTIRGETRPGGGAVFHVELPVAPLDRPRPLPSGVALASLPAKAILVVDDETEVAEVLAEMLESDGHRVDRAHNGAQALERLDAGSYDLILTDLKMPELDGPGLYREAGRRDPALLGRFVFLTGDTLSPEITKFLEQARRPTLGKPFAPDEVRRVIIQALEIAVAGS